MKKWKLLTVPLAVAIFLSGCGTKINEELKTADVLASGTTVNDPYNSEYMQIAENEKLSFWFNKDTTAFKLVDKSDGYEWYSTSSSQQSDTAENAPFTLTFVNSSGVIESIDAMTGSIASGQYEYERTENGIKVTYSVGDFSELLAVPLAISQERKEFILENIEDEFKQGQFDIMYQLIDYDALDEENKKNFSTLYPGLKNGPLYILRESITSSDSKMKELALLLTENGYTDEMYEEDCKLFKSETNGNSENEAKFRIQLDYSLTEDGLKITVPQKEIQMNASCPLVGIELHKYMFSPERGSEGYFLLPDGSGSLMNFYNGRGDLQDYNTKIYGLDYSAAVSEYVYNYDQSYLPIWGVKNGSHAVFTVIEEGSAIAEINAFPGNERLDAYAAATFQVRSYQKSFLSSNSGEANYFVNVQNERYNGDISLRLVLLNGEKADFAGMADWYRNYLFGEEETVTSGAPGLLLECVGLLDKQTQTLGIKHNEKYSATTFEKAGEIAGELQDAGIENLSVKLSGWCNGAYHGRYAGKMAVNKELGGKEGLLKLGELLKERDINFYPDVDFQYTYTTGLLDGFSPKRDVAELITHATGYRIDFNPATFCRDPKYKTPAYINSPNAVNKAFNSFFEYYDELEFEGISLGKIGRELNADYSDENGTDREEAMKNITQALENTDENYSILTSGINAYTLSAVDYCSDVPLVSNERDNTDESVPFVQMVLSGYVRYSGEAVNLSGGSQTLWLRMAAVAADAYYVITARYAEQVRDSDYSFLYCSDYGYLSSDMLRDVSEYQQKMDGISGKRLIGYTKLEEQLYRSEFEGGATVTVNYSLEDKTYQNTVYPAKSYTVEKGG